MNENAPTRKQRLNHNLGGSDDSTGPKIHKGNNDLKALNDIATKWVDKRCYPTLDRALRALVIGDL